MLYGASYERSPIISDSVCRPAVRAMQEDPSIPTSSATHALIAHSLRLKPATAERPRPLSEGRRQKPAKCRNLKQVAAGIRYGDQQMPEITVCDG